MIWVIYDKDEGLDGTKFKYINVSFKALYKRKEIRMKDNTRVVLICFLATLSLTGWDIKLKKNDVELGEIAIYFHFLNLCEKLFYGQVKIQDEK